MNTRVLTFRFNRYLVTLIVMASTVLSFPTFGQGLITFANKVAGVVDAPIFDVDGKTLLGGPAFMAQLYAGPIGNSLQPVGSPLPFFINLGVGYFPPTNEIVPGVLPGEVAAFQVRAWRTADGSTFEAADHLGGHAGTSGILELPLGSGRGAGPYLIGLQSFSLQIVPEPASLALVIIGIVALLLQQRRPFVWKRDDLGNLNKFN